MPKRARFAVFACGFACAMAACLNLTQAVESSAKEIPEKDEPAIIKAVKALKAGDLQASLDLFNQAARDKPDSVEAHYGRACTLMELGRKDEAIKEFKLVLLLGPSESTAKLCNEKLSSLGAGMQKTEISNLAQPTTIRTQDVEQSISKILKQSEEKIKDIHAGGERFASHVYNSRSLTHNRLMEQAKQEANEMRRARLRFGNRLLPAFSSEEILQRQAELQYKSMAALERAKTDYEQRKQESESRALGIKASAEGLESQMITKPSETSGIILVPNGTNLYVRNYSHFDPIMPEPPVPLQAVPLKLPQLIRLEEEEKAKKHKTKKQHPSNGEKGQ